MRIVGPLTLTPSAPNTIADPAQAGGNPSVACQIQNSSQFQLTVIAAGATLSIQPFTAQTVEISGQPLIVTPITSSTGLGPAAMTFVFLLGTPPNTGVQLTSGQWCETPPQQDGPLTAAAIAAATQGTVDVLTSQAVVNFPVGLTTIAPPAAVHAYTAVMLVITNLPAAAVTVNVLPQLSVGGVLCNFPPQTQVSTPSAEQVTFLFAMPVPVGATFGFNVTVDTLSNGAKVSVLGITGTEAVQVNAPLGNPLAVAPRGGKSQATVTVTNGTTAILLAAPPSGMSYRLHAFNVTPAGIPAAGAVLILKGHSSAFNYGAMTPLSICQILLDGQIATEALDIQNATTQTMVCYVSYDVIPTPTVQ